jgi:hypothetical protein
LEREIQMTAKRLPNVLLSFRVIFTKMKWHNVRDFRAVTFVSPSVTQTVSLATFVRWFVHFFIPTTLFSFF